MTRRAPAVAILLLSISGVRFVDPLLQDGFGSLLGPFAAAKQVKIPELLYQLCNNTQGSNATQRDACYGCFYRASTLQQGYPMLIAMSMCANTYLNNTNYGHCQAYLRNATTMPSTQVTPTIIYCTFLECVRQVRKDTLLRECINQSRGMIAMFNSTETQLVRLFVNTTACVLARTRCSYMNPVTGELQNNDIVHKLHLHSFNALFVNTDYDITIVQLPFGQGFDVCSKYRNVQQASWPGVVC